MSPLLRRLLRLERRLLSRPAQPAPPAGTVCERCGLLVDTACWHRHCPLTRSRPR